MVLTCCKVGLSSAVRGMRELHTSPDFFLSNSLENNNGGERGQQMDAQTQEDKICVDERDKPMDKQAIMYIMYMGNI